MGKKRLTNFECIRQFRKTHGNHYDYSLVKYLNSKSKVKIICPIHGVFEQIPNSHTLGKGCYSCGEFNRAEKKKHNASLKILSEFKTVHGDRYDYSLMVYKTAKTLIKIICKKHGIFEQIPAAHKRGAKCYECAKEDSGRSRLKNSVAVIADFKKIHGDIYDYSEVVYIGNKKKIKIICTEHGEFQMLPNSHLSGQGCPQCAKVCDFDVVYIWNIPNTNIYKIGVTSKRLGIKRVKQVAYSMGVDYTILRIAEIPNALIVETELHNTYQIVPTTLPDVNGSSEFRVLTESDVNEILWYLDYKEKQNDHK